MKTAPIKSLVRSVLATLPRPYSEHVIDEVFAAIEQSDEWQREYEGLCTSFTKTVVNTWGAYWIANALGKVGEKVTPSKRSTLIGSYSLLDTDAKTALRKPKESEALELMSAYFQTHKATLPPEVRKYRDPIVELIMEGSTPEEAFAYALRALGDA